MPIRYRLAACCATLALFASLPVAADPLGYKILFLRPTAADPATLDVAPNVDYYSILISSVFLDRDEGFFKKNNVAVVAALTIDGREFTLPVYAKRDPGVSGLLGIHNYSLLTSIPASGGVTQVGIEMRRRNLDDPVKKVMDFAASRDMDGLLKTYAASAVPYVSMFGALAKSLYASFGSPADGEILFSTEKISLAQSPAAEPDSFRLRDSVFLIYRSDVTLDDARLHLDNSGNIICSYPDGDRALQGFPWVAIRIQRFPKRLDYANRDWYLRFQEAYQQVLSADGSGFADSERTSAGARVLLFADKDFTLAQKQQEAADWKATLDAAKRTAQLGRGRDLVTARESARRPLTALKLGETPVTTHSLVSAPGTRVAPGSTTIDITRLKAALQAVPQ
jgi:hypothetical protein